MSKILKPPRLRKGDVIGVIAPASPMKPELLESGVRYLEGLGYRVKLGKHIFKKHGYLAGTDKERAQDLNNMFRDRRVHAIICARGGYGTPRLLPLLDYQAMQQQPKVFVGYSDLTALQLAIFKHAKLITFSGPMVAADMGRGLDSFTEENFWRMMTSPTAFGEVQRPNGESYGVISKGKVTGRLIGGCLSLIAPIAGTRHMPSLTDSIFFVEDVGEVVYRWDRFFAQFRELGLLQRIGGFMLGQATDCLPPEGEATLTFEDLMRDFIKPLKVPALMGLDYGHGRVKHTMPIGARAELEVSSRRTRLMITEAAVS
ncbi:LD-carboxypeptidase [candidate division KSB1 bacterium]|nr:LD-carboxypeptidase [candidate division KSB1 bacterium]